ncbi:MAG: PAS domain-containing sensor histidine kinase [Bacteroidota bacterium]
MNILHTGLQEETLEWIKQGIPLAEVAFVSLSEAEVVAMTDHPQPAEILIIGEKAQNPIRLAQQVYRFDATLSVLLINEAHAHAKVKQAFQFTPFIGPTIHTVSNAAKQGLAAVVADHVLRTEQRRNYRLLKASSSEPTPAFLPAYEQVKTVYLNRVLEEAPIGLVLFTRQGIILSFNQQASLLFHTSERAVMGTSILDLLPEEAQNEWQRMVQESDHGTTKHIIALARPGQQRYVAVTVTTLDYSDASGYKIGLFSDVTDQQMAGQALQESKERFQAAVEAVQGILWTNNAEGQMEGPQPGWAALTGQSHQEYQGYGWAQAIHPEDAQATVEAWTQAVKERKPFVFEHRVRRKNGNWGIFSIRSIPLLDSQGQIREWVGVHTDVTQQRQAEEERHLFAQELAANNEELQAANEEIKANNEELAKVNQALLHTNIDLDNFVYSASHDLKGPIANLEGLLRILSRQLKPQLQGQELKMLDLMNEALGKFKDTLQGMLDMAKVQKNLEEETERVMLSQLLEEVKEDIGDLMEQQGAEIQADFQEVEISFARPKLRSILYNLLSNALKYRSPQRLAVVLLKSFDEGDYCVLSIEDNGLGISESQLSKLFSMFKRFHTHVEGTGIGLYIIKRIIENSGGKITVESREGIGTKFTVYFKKYTTAAQKVQKT